MNLTSKSLFVLGAMFCFALMAVFTRGADAPILTIAAWRAVVVAAVFAAWAFAVEGSSAFSPDRKTLRLGAWYGLALAVASSTFVGGYALTTVAHTIFLHNLAPVVAFPLAWWMFREQPSASTIAGAGIALVGVGLLSGVSLFHFAHFTDPRFLLGDFLAVVSAVGYAAVLVLTRLTRTEETPILGTLFVAWAVAAVALVVVAGLFGTLSISVIALLWVVGLAVVSTNIPFYLLNLGMKEISASLAALLSMSELFFATIIGVLFYRESLAPIGWVGGALVVVGVLYPFFQSQEEQEPAQPLDPGTVPVRWARVGLALLLLNVGAGVLLLTGNGVGAVLAWAGAIALLRLGPSLVLANESGGFARWVIAVLALGALAGVLLRGGWESPGLTPLVLIAAVAALLDGLLAGREVDEDRDTQPLFQLALWLVVAGQCVAALAHPAGDWLVAAAVGALSLAAFGVLARCFGAGKARYDGVVSVLVQPRRVLLIALVLFVAGGLHAVPTGHRAVVERFGAPSAEALDAGLVLRFPPPIERLEIVNVSSVRRVEVLAAGSTLLAGDQSMVSTGAVLHYTVSDPMAYAYGAGDPDVVLREEARAAMVAAVGRRSQDDILTTGRASVEDEVAHAAQRTADRLNFGVRIASIRLTDVAVPAPALASFLDVISADEDRRTVINQAHAYAAKLLPEALGQAVAAHEGALAYATRHVADARAEQSRFVAQARGAKAGRGVTETRMRMEALEGALVDRSVVVAAESLRVWLGGDGPVAGTAPDEDSAAKERSVR